MTVEPKTQTFLNSLVGAPPIYTLPIDEARQVLIKLQSGEVAKEPADIEDRMIPGGPKGEVAVRIVRPKGNSTRLPAVIYLHGGGWILGNAQTHDRLLRALAQGAQVGIVFVNYSPAPEAKYPTALEEAYAVTKYVAEHGEELNLDGSRLAVAGDSVGGNLATVVTILANEHGGPKIDFQLLFYPVTDANFETPSYQQFAKGYYLEREGMKWFWNAYLPDESARNKTTVSPLRATRQQLRGLPPALVITAENDVLRDEGEAYAHKLAEAGVDVMAVRYLGTIHDFMMLNALADTPAARGAVTQASDTLRKVFSRQAKPSQVTMWQEDPSAKTSRQE